MFVAINMKKTTRISDMSRMVVMLLVLMFMAGLVCSQSVEPEVLITDDDRSQEGEQPNESSSANTRSGEPSSEERNSAESYENEGRFLMPSHPTANETNLGDSTKGDTVDETDSSQIVPPRKGLDNDSADNRYD